MEVHFGFGGLNGQFCHMTNLKRLKIRSYVSHLSANVNTLENLLTSNEFPSVTNLSLQLIPGRDYSSFVTWKRWSNLTTLALYSVHGFVSLDSKIASKLQNLRKLELRHIEFTGREIAGINTPDLEECRLLSSKNVELSKNVGHLLRHLVCVLYSPSTIEKMFKNVTKIQRLELNLVQDDDDDTDGSRAKKIDSWFLDSNYNPLRGLRHVMLHGLGRFWTGSSPTASFGPNVEEIQISGCHHFSEDHIFYHDYSKLRHLKITNSPIIFNEFSDPWRLTERLTRLEFSGLTSITDFFFQVNVFPNLEEFNLTFCLLHDNSKLTGTKWNPFPKLRHLLLTNREHSCSDEFFGNITTPKLEYLALLAFENNDLAGIGWKSENFKILKMIEIYGREGRFCDDILINNDLPSLNRLSLAVDFYEGQPMKWRCRSNIKELDLFHCYDLKDAFFQASDPSQVIFPVLQKLVLDCCFAMNGSSWNYLPELRSFTMKGFRLGNLKFMSNKPFPKECEIKGWI